MRWTSKSFILDLKRYNDRSYILEAFTYENGRHKGLIRGIHSKNLRGVVEPGNEVVLHWSGRLETHLGNFSVEPIRSWSSLVLENKEKLMAMSSLCSIISATMAEKQQNISIYNSSIELIKKIVDEKQSWIKNYIFWELNLLSEIGYGLDLSECAVTNNKEDLKYISPASGRAVTKVGAGNYKDKLFELPEFFLDIERQSQHKDIINAINITEYFLKKRFYEPNNLNFPQSRNRLKEALNKINYEN